MVFPRSVERESRVPEVFTEVRRRSRVLSVGGGHDYSSVTEVTSKVLAEVVLIEVTERLRGYLARGCVIPE